MTQEQQGDFEYAKCGLFTSIFPVSAPAIAEYNRLNLGDGTGKLLPMEFEAFKAQARRAGYSVKRAERIQASEVDAIRAELEL